MVLPTTTKFFLSAVMVLFILAMSGNVLAVSSSNPNKVRDFKLTPSSGKVLRRSDVSLEVRRNFDGARPRIVRRLSGKANCYDVKFVYKSQLRRVSFNCTTTRLIMHAKYLK